MPMFELGLNESVSYTRLLTFVCRDLDVTQHKVFLSGQAFSPE